MYAIINSFNAGELSPKMLSRPDVSQYGKGCRTLQNFLVKPYGSAERRPGTIYIQDIKFHGKKVRLIPFIVASEVSYICEFGDGYIRFFRDDAMVQEIVSPYSENELASLKYVQSADVMFLCHGNHMVRELRRTQADVFEIRVMELTYPPVLDPNLSDITITPSAQTGSITLTASADVFQSGHENSYWQLCHVRPSGAINKTFTASGVTESLEVYGTWNLSTRGTWIGTLKLQRSTDGGVTWLDYATYISDADNNAENSGDETEEDVYYRCVLTDYQEAEGNVNKYCKVIFNNNSTQVYGVVQITGVSSGRSASGKVIKKLGGTGATKDWQEGAWSGVRGYPRTVAFYEERLMFGGTDYQSQTIWGSKTNDWNNFRLGDKDDDGLAYTLSSDTINTICWMTQHDCLIIGTLDSEWKVSASSFESALTPTNVMIRRQSVFGSKDIAAKLAGDIIVFVQRQGRKMRGFVYSYQKDGYESPDLTMLADHINETGIEDFTLQQQPDTVLWCLLGDGTVSALTYERDQEVIGWQRIVTDGKVKSIAILPRAEDTIYIAVERNGRTMLERFAPREWENITDAVYTDSSRLYEYEEPVAEVNALEHLEGKTVQVLADGAAQYEKVVTDGKIELDDPARKITVGLGYESILSPMPYEIQMQDGFSALRRKVIAELRIRVYKSLGGEARTGIDVWQEIISRDALHDEVNKYIVPKDEVVQIQTASGYQPEGIIEIRQRDPLPLNVACLTAILDVAE